MPVGEPCIRQVVVAPPNTSVLEAAKLMRHHDEIDGRRSARWDRHRDIVVRENSMPQAFRPGDIMTSDL
jgi:CBS domain-containing protein